MGKISQYNQVKRTTRALVPKTVLVTLGVAGVSAAFAFMQLALHFALSDLSQETTRLQSQKIELRDVTNRLRGEVARLEQGGRLFEFAEASGMIEYPTSKFRTLKVDNTRIEKYEFALAELRGKSAGETTTERGWARALASRLGLESQAIAAEVSPGVAVAD